jgi:PAS domain S-box-containing protein
MIVEDDPNTRKMMKASLQCEGYTVLEASDGKTALELAEKELPNLILHDLMLPDTDGFTSVERLRALPGATAVPIIAVSGRFSDDDGVRKTKDHFATFLQKPIEPSRLVQIIKIYLRQIEELRQSEEKFRQMAENIQDVFWMSNADLTKIEYVSPAYETIWGRTCASLYENPRSFLEGIHEEDRERVVKTLDLTKEFEIEYRVVQPNGAIRWILDRGFPVCDDFGQVYRSVGVARDITERKRTEEELKKTEARLRQSQKLEGIGQLAGGIAHDFNNLLTVINGYSDMILQTLHSDHPIKAEVEAIREAGQRAARLTRQILAFSRQQALNPVAFNLNASVTGTEKLLRRLLGEHIILETSVEPNLGQVKADQGQVDQVIINLAVNARDAMPNGGSLKIETRNVELDESFTLRHPGMKAGPYVNLTVTDNGCGMDQATQARIFEPFFTTKEAGQGTGLGLATVYGIVTQSGGAIDVESALGKGSTFSVYLPRLGNDVGSSCVPEAKGVCSPRGAETILVVEDDDLVRSLTRQILRQHGYLVFDARNGIEAQKFCSTYDKPVDLLLTDLILPGLNGAQLAEQIRSARPDTKILYMSGYQNQLLKDNFPGMALITKPFVADALARKVRVVLDGGPGH